MPGTVSYTNNEPQWVIFNGVLLGLTGPGDITLSLKGEWVDKLSHQTGNYLLDAFWKGERATVTASLAEVDNLDNWVVAFPIGEKQQDQATPPATRFVGFPEAANQPYIGMRAESYDAKLVLRPVGLYAAVGTQTVRDIVIPKAFARGVADILYSIDTDELLPITWEGLFNPDATDGETLWFRGLETETGAWSAV